MLDDEYRQYFLDLFLSSVLFCFLFFFFSFFTAQVLYLTPYGAVRDIWQLQNGLRLSATILGLTENEELPSATSSQNYWPNQKINEIFV